MARYVDAFVLPVPKKNLAVYRKMSAAAGKIWKEHGALEYIESAGDDLKVRSGMTGFRKIAGAKASETVFFSFIVYASKAERNRVNKKVMKDPRILGMMEGKEMPFDVKRMAYGGFKAVVDL